MKFNLKIIISGILSLVLLTSLFVFRRIPVACLWKGYSVVYADVSIPSATMMQALSDNGCADVIASSDQQLPIMTPVPSASAETNDSSYLSRRTGYFYDHDHHYNLFYVPERYESGAVKAVQNISLSTGYTAGVDATPFFSIEVPVVCILVFILFLLFSKNKIVYFLISVYPVFFAVTSPFYTNAAGVCLCLYGLYLFQKIWNRKGSSDVILRNIFILFSLIFPVCIITFVSVISGILYLVSLSGSVLLSVCVYELVHVNKKDLSFIPVPIIPAQFIHLIYKKTVSQFFISIGASAILFCFAAAGSIGGVSEKLHQVSLPAPVKQKNNNEVLPGISDYTDWVWNLMVFPYTSLNDTKLTGATAPSEGETLLFPEYSFSADGKIEETDKSLYVYNSNFRKSVIDDIDNLPYPAIEKMMKKQGSHVSVIYLDQNKKSSGKAFSDLKMLLMLGISLFAPLLLILYYISGRKKYVSSI